MIAALALSLLAPAALPSPPVGECDLFIPPSIEREEPTLLDVEGEATGVVMIIVCSIRVPQPTASNPGATVVQQYVQVFPLDMPDYKMIVDAARDIVDAAGLGG